MIRAMMTGLAAVSAMSVLPAVQEDPLSNFLKRLTAQHARWKTYSAKLDIVEKDPAKEQAVKAAGELYVSHHNGKTRLVWKEKSDRGYRTILIDEKGGAVRSRLDGRAVQTQFKKSEDREYLPQVLLASLSEYKQYNWFVRRLSQPKEGTLVPVEREKEAAPDSTPEGGPSQDRPDPKIASPVPPQGGGGIRKPPSIREPALALKEENLDGRPDLIVLELAPRDEKAILKLLRFAFDAETLAVRNIEVEFLNGRRLEVKISRFKTDVEIPEHIFER